MKLEAEVTNHLCLKVVIVSVILRILFHILLLAVVVRHGDNGEDEVDKVERAHENNDHKEEDVQATVGSDYLKSATVIEN
jgi:hypothetical protein